MATVVSTVTVNAAFLQEIKEDNLELRRLLAGSRRMLGSTRPTPHATLDLLGRLCDQLAMHFALEEAYGYFDEPLAAAPRLTQQAEVLRGEHQMLFVELRDLVDDLADLVSRRASSALHEAAHRFAMFDERLRDHESRENALILEAFQDDIGVGD